MNVDDRTRFIISAIAVGISFLGMACSLVVMLVGGPRRAATWGVVGLAIGIGSFILFECSGVAKKKLKERWSSASYSSSRKARVMRALAGCAAILILVTIVAFQTPRPLVLFSIGAGSTILALIIVLIWAKFAGYL